MTEERRTTTATWQSSDDTDETAVVEIDIEEFTENFDTTRSRLESLNAEQLVRAEELKEQIEYYEGRGWNGAADLHRDMLSELISPGFGKSDRVSTRIEALRDRIETKEYFNQPTEESRRKLRRYRLGRIGVCATDDVEDDLDEEVI